MNAAEPDRAIEDAWRIHAALVDWTSKVDQKASFVLAIESAAVLGVISLSERESGKDKLLSSLNSILELLAYRIGVVFLVVAVILVAAAVIPQLRRNEVSDESDRNFIFFGHLKSWKQEELTQALRERDVLPVLSRQLIKMSEIAWKKHRRLQRSLWLAGAGIGLVGLAAVLDTGLLDTPLDWLIFWN